MLFIKIINFGFSFNNNNVCLGNFDKKGQKRTKQNKKTLEMNSQYKYNIFLNGEMSEFLIASVIAENGPK